MFHAPETNPEAANSLAGRLKTIFHTACLPIHNVLKNPHIVNNIFTLP